MPVSRRLRFEILRRDSHTCRYCGAAAPDVKLTVDHVIPEALGGGEDPRNLVTACQDCNAGKSSVAPDQAIVEDVDSAALLFARATAKAAEIRRRQIAEMEQVLAAFNTEWEEYDDIPRPTDWADSVERFIANGIHPDELTRLIAIAMGSRASARGVWKYFCGCCWREITDRQELARRLVEDGEV